MSRHSSEIHPAQDDDEEKPHIIDDADEKIESEMLMRTQFEEMGVIKTIRVFKRAVLIGALAAFATAFDGYQISITGSIIANKGFIRQFGLGMLTMHFIADGFGRKPAFFAIWTALLIGVCFESFGKTWQLWLVTKLFSGYSVGCIQFMNGLYMSEISPTRIRGFLITSCFIWYGIGQLFASVALKVLNDSQPLNYLDAVYTEWAMVGLLLGIYLYIPESPYWCALHGRHDTGRKVMKRLYESIDGFDTDYHYDIIKVTVEQEQEDVQGPSSTLRERVRINLSELKQIFTGTNGLRTLIAFMPSAVQQIGGLTVLSTYASYFAQTAGFADPFLYSLLLAVSALVMVIACAFITDKSGRRRLFLFAVTGQWVVSWVIGGMGLAPKGNKAIDGLVLFFSLVWRMLSTALGTLHWTYSAETSSSRLRAKTAGVASAGGIVIGIIFSTSVPYMLNPNYADWGLRTILFFGGLSTPVVIASYFLMPDTSNRTPAELNDMFEAGVKPWRFRSYVTEAQKRLEESKVHAT